VVRSLITAVLQIYWWVYSEEFWKLVNISLNYCQEFSGFLFEHGVDIWSVSHLTHRHISATNKTRKYPRKSFPMYFHYRYKYNITVANCLSATVIGHWLWLPYVSVAGQVSHQPIMQQHDSDKIFWFPN